MCFAEGLARFALASWQAMARTGGIGNKIYSPYSAFIALMMVALLSSGDAKTEILRTLNVDNCEVSNKRLAVELAHFIEHTEYAEAFYNTGFEAVVERVEKLHECSYASLTKTQRVWLYLKAVKTLGSEERVLSASGEDLEAVADLFVQTAGKPFVIATANDIWATLEANDTDFSEIVEHLKASVRTVEFPEPGRTMINEYIEEKTHGLIKDLLSPSDVTDETEIILTNALYFKGQWERDFRPTTGNWSGFDGLLKNVDMLHHVATHRIRRTSDASLIALQYGGSDYSMVIALPKQEGELGFKQMVESLTEDHLRELMNAEEAYAEVSLPKFTTEWGTQSLKDVLGELGIKSVFTEGILDGRYKVSDVVQKARINVDEHGTEAAAATAAIIVKSAFISDPVPFLCNRPFMYYIFNEANGAILFMGSVTDPSILGA